MFPIGSTNPDDLSAIVAQQAEQIKLLQSQVNGLLSRLDSQTGELKNVQCGFARLDREGIVLLDASSSPITEEGLLRLNSQTSRFEGYSGSAWRVFSSW